MSEKYKAKNPGGIYFITLTIVGWIDLFTRPAYKHIIINSLKYCVKEKGLRIFAYVIMSSHIHLIVKDEDGKLNYIIRDFKRYTSIELKNAILQSPESRREWMLMAFSNAAESIKRNKHYKIWKDGYHPVELTDSKMIDQKVDYIHHNPVEAEIVRNPEDYKYSSAANIAGKGSELEIETM